MTMTKPPRKNKHNSNNQDFTYFNNPNYFGFDNPNWNFNPNTLDYYSNNSQLPSWDDNPTPCKYYSSYNGVNTSSRTNYPNNTNNSNYYHSSNQHKYSSNNYHQRYKPKNSHQKTPKNSFINKKVKKDFKSNESEKKKKKIIYPFKINKKKSIDEIETDIHTIDDLVTVGKLYKQKDFKYKNYSINLKGIFKMTEALKYLKDMIGLKTIKSKILEQIIFFSQDIHHQAPILTHTDTPKPKSSLDKLFSKYLDNEDESEISSGVSLEIKNKCDMLHTVIEGPPGVGKTQLGKILAKIYLSLGITQSDKFRIATRKDFIGEYLGHTAIKTQKVIDSCLGGVLFIDEAYSLGNGDNKKDTFSKECIDTLNQNLSENKGKFVCIIAGYKENLEHDFFSVNPGLQRRFPFRYSIDKYTSEELTQIFMNKVSDIKWSLNEDCQTWLNESKFIDDKMEQFQNFGGDIESWLLHCKIEHAKRVFGKCYSHHKILTQNDILKGYQRFLDNKSNSQNKNKCSLNMYL